MKKILSVLAIVALAACNNSATSEVKPVDSAAVKPATDTTVPAAADTSAHAAADTTKAK